MTQQELIGTGLHGPLAAAPDAGEDLKSKLKEPIGKASQFKLRHFAKQRQAFEKECEMFHQFLPVGNFLHPSRPQDTDWTCPRCRR